MQLFNKGKFMPFIISGVTEKGEYLDGYTAYTKDLNASIDLYVTERPDCVRVMIDIAITPPSRR